MMTTVRSNCCRKLQFMSYCLAASLLLAAPAVAQDIGYDIATDSEIRLLERSDEGSYQHRSIIITSRNQETTISTVQDDVKAQDSMPFEVYAALWRFAIARNLASIEDAPLENAFPGQSTFNFSFRDGETLHQFSSYGVDFLTDTRYRELAREIIRIAEQQFSDVPQ